MPLLATRQAITPIVDWRLTDTITYVDSLIEVYLGATVTGRNRSSYTDTLSSIESITGTDNIFIPKAHLNYGASWRWAGLPLRATR